MNKIPTSGHIDGHAANLFFKGIFFELAPVTIPLCVADLVQNTVLFVDYYKERSKLVPWFFMGIALADILKAQGEIVLAVTSILVYSGVCNVDCRGIA